jgi:hypothetical protein
MKWELKYPIHYPTETVVNHHFPEVMGVITQKMLDTQAYKYRCEFQLYVGRDPKLELHIKFIYN